MPANFDLSKLALQMLCPDNDILYDDKGLPSVMVRLPKRTYAQLGMGSSTAVYPAFIVNGQEVDEIWISKYMNIVHDGRAYSLPGRDFANNLTWDTARGYCEAKGRGWHMMTRMEWGLVVRLCQSFGVMPKGNNNYGRHVSEDFYKATPVTFGTGADAGKIFHTAGGTGPLTWRHDQTLGGICDLVGNGSEWHGGIRRKGRELQILANNDGADKNNAQTDSAATWKAIDGTTGALITPNGSGTTTNSIKMKRVNSTAMQYVLTDPGNWSGAVEGPHSGITCAEDICDAAKLLLQSLGLLMYDNNDLFGDQNYYMNCNNAEERLFISGSVYAAPSRGLASFLSNYSTSRTNVSPAIGFRSAYVKLPSA